MKTQKMACFDVYYYRDYARACCLVFEIEPRERILSRYSATVKPVHDYIPGELYRRELPGILKVYGRVKEKIGLAIVDGFVYRKRQKGVGRSPLRGPA